MSSTDNDQITVSLFPKFPSDGVGCTQAKHTVLFCSLTGNQSEGLQLLLGLSGLAIYLPKIRSSASPIFDFLSECLVSSQLVSKKHKFFFPITFSQLDHFLYIYECFTFFNYIGVKKCL